MDTSVVWQAHCTKNIGFAADIGCLSFFAESSQWVIILQQPLLVKPIPCLRSFASAQCTPLQSMKMSLLVTRAATNPWRQPTKMSGTEKCSCKFHMFKNRRTRAWVSCLFLSTIKFSLGQFPTFAVWYLNHYIHAYNLVLTTICTYDVWEMKKSYIRGPWHIGMQCSTSKRNY